MSAFNIYNGNGTQTQFPITFDYFDDDDIEVWLWNETIRKWQPCIEGVNYNIVGNNVEFIDTTVGLGLGGGGSGGGLTPPDPDPDPTPDPDPDPTPDPDPDPDPPPGGLPDGETGDPGPPPSDPDPDPDPDPSTPPTYSYTIPVATCFEGVGSPTFTLQKTVNGLPTGTAFTDIKQIIGITYQGRSACPGFAEGKYLLEYVPSDPAIYNPIQTVIGAFLYYGSCNGDFSSWQLVLPAGFTCFDSGPSVGGLPPYP
tara:strand:- start:38 stop:802 length:765 start_codon:yes stop_codon:yes gene_type:complete